MAEATRTPNPENPTPASAISQVKITISNNFGEKLVGVLHETGSQKIIILCHGFRSSKEDAIVLNLASSLTNQEISIFRFDFAGNGQSEGLFQYGNYRRETDDLRAVVLYFLGLKHEIIGIIGHSKGGDVVLLYASNYRDIHTVVNISGRFALQRGMEGRLGNGFMKQIRDNGFIDVKNKIGQIEYRVTEESLMDRLGTDMHSACLSIDKDCRVLTIHGSEDAIVSSKDAFEFAKVIPNHKLHIIQGANHVFSSHMHELCSIVLDFLRSNQTT